jgi:hypothetical protein
MEEPICYACGLGDHKRCAGWVPDQVEGYLVGLPRCACSCQPRMRDSPDLILKG